MTETNYKIGYIKRGKTRNWQYITFSNEILAARWLFENLADCDQISYKVVKKLCL